MLTHAKMHDPEGVFVLGYLNTMGEYRINTKCVTGISVKMGVNAALNIPAKCLP